MVTKRNPSPSALTVKDDSIQCRTEESFAGGVNEDVTCGGGALKPMRLPAQDRQLAFSSGEEVGLLEVSRLCKSFAGHQVVKDVSFDVEAGEVFAFLGQNGAGKTTTIKMCVGLLLPDTGTIRIKGLDPQKTRGTITRFGALLEGNRNVYWRMTPYENLRYFGVLKGLSIGDASNSARALLDRFDLTGKSRQQVHRLSRGMQQKLAIAVAMLNRPKVLFLDEPTLGLDVESVAQIIDLIRELSAEGTAIVLTTHQLDIAQTLSDRIAIIHQGRIVKTASTDALLREFSPFGYEVRLSAPLGTEVEARVARDFDAHVEGEKVYLPGDGDRIYDLLQALRPAAVEYVGKQKTDLTEIFLKLTGGKSDA